MDDNKDIEKVSRSVFENLKMDAPDDAWNKLDADLDKKQAVVYKKRANRFKLLSIVLLLIIFSFTTWHYLIPTSSSNKLEKVISQEKAKNIRASSINIQPKENSASNIPSVNLIPSNNKDKFKESMEKEQSLELYKPQNKQLAFKFNAASKEENKKLIRNEKKSNISEIINLTPDKKETITESNSTIAHSNSNEVAIVANDSSNTIVSEQNILTTTIVDNGLPQLADTNKSESPALVKNDSLFKKDLHSKSRLSLMVFYSLNQSWSNLKDNSNDNFDDVAMYNSRENSKFSYTTGINIKYDINDKWSLLTGATYSQIAKSITIQTMYAEPNAANEIHFLFPTSSGVIEMPFDDSHPNLHPGDSINAKAVCNQSIKFINVPLIVRFELKKNKFIWYANAGVSANFIVQEKAKISINNPETTIVNQIKGLKKMNYGFLIGAGVQYNLRNDFGVFIEPMFRGSFTSITYNTSVNSYPNSIGLNLGFSLHF